MLKEFGWRAAGMVALIAAAIAVWSITRSNEDRERDAAFAACRGDRVEGYDTWGRVRLCVTEVPSGTR